MSHRPHTSRCLSRLPGYSPYSERSATTIVEKRSGAMLRGITVGDQWVAGFQVPGREGSARLCDGITTEVSLREDRQADILAAVDVQQDWPRQL